MLNLYVFDILQVSFIEFVYIKFLVIFLIMCTIEDNRLAERQETLQRTGQNHLKKQLDMSVKL